MADSISDQGGCNQLNIIPALESNTTPHGEFKGERNSEGISPVATNESENHEQRLDTNSQAENAILNANNDIELSEQELKQFEEEFASSFVAGVLKRVVKELSPKDNGDARGGTFVNDGKIQDKYSDNHLENGNLVNQGAGDHDQVAATVTEKTVGSSPIIVPTDRDFPGDQIENNNNNFDKSSIHNVPDEKTSLRSTCLPEHNELRSAKEDSLLRGYIPPSQEGQEVFVRSGIQGQEFHHPDHSSYYRQFPDDSASQIGRTSNIPAGVLEIQIPQHMLKSYAAGHVISVPAYHHREGEQFPHSQVSQSYPPPAELFSSHHSHSQTFSQRSTPTQKLVQFPKLRSSSVGFRGEFLSAEQRSPSRFSQRQKLPPAVARMSSVMMTTRERTEKQRMMSTYYEERTPTKLLSLDQCINSRPPMPFDLDTPGPCRYTPRNQPLYETNSPKYTFGYKFFERGKTLACRE